MLEKEELRASQDKINGAGGGDDGGGVEAVFTSSVDNLLQSEKSTEESAYDTLRPETKVEENTYDSLQPQKKVQENDYDILSRLNTIFNLDTTLMACITSRPISYYVACMVAVYGEKA